MSITHVTLRYVNDFTLRKISCFWILMRADVFWETVFVDKH